jgi:hypothetical protein
LRSHSAACQQAAVGALRFGAVTQHAFKFGLLRGIPFAHVRLFGIEFVLTFIEFALGAGEFPSGAGGFVHDYLLHLGFGLVLGGQVFEEGGEFARVFAGYDWEWMRVLHGAVFALSFRMRVG